VWALGSAGAIASFPVLRRIDGLTILAEVGKASANGIKQCGNRWHEAGIEVIVADPLAGSDINDSIREAAT
jgi:putative DNA primase/helicase